MIVCSEYIIIWLDSDTERLEDYRDMKREFQMALEENSAVRLNLYGSFGLFGWALHTYFNPILFEDNREQTLRCIKDNADKKIILIESPSLARWIIPHVLKYNLSVEACYIFYVHIKYHVDWALEYVDYGLDLKMFDFETDLMAKLRRDMSKRLPNSNIYLKLHSILTLLFKSLRLLEFIFEVILHIEKVKILASGFIQLSKTFFRPSRSP
ncbi:unnamed protein product [Rotaria magnacalcarata]|uniref:Uncharacterized protein n=1 Tax=Rotaria magnacalcarata TaxID=392030 RepID=A0A8S2JKT5_9BILA|nr:unnamed protein product [Rotaria magnacalcarata]CAF3810525.1 unnamed protein product [Rotaria magnacalcarata]